MNLFRASSKRAGTVFVDALGADYRRAVAVEHRVLCRERCFSATASPKTSLGVTKPTRGRRWARDRRPERRHSRLPPTSPLAAPRHHASGGQKQRTAMRRAHPLPSANSDSRRALSAVDTYTRETRAASRVSASGELSSRPHLDCARADHLGSQGRIIERGTRRTPRRGASTRAIWTVTTGRLAASLR